MAKTDPFAAYVMPLGLTEGVDIPLPGTPAVFSVVLPGSTNEDFTMALMSRLNVGFDEGGKRSEVDTGMFQRERKKLFFETCVLDARGLPKDMGMDEFFAKYPLAARGLYEKANELAEQADNEVNDSLGKWNSSPNGKSSGKEKAINTTA